MLLIPEKAECRNYLETGTANNISVGKAGEASVCGMGYHTPLLAALLTETIKPDNYPKK